MITFGRIMRLIKYIFQVIWLILTVNSMAKDTIELTVSNNNKFAWELYSQLKTNNNLFFSPYGISNVIAMTYAGANGNTADQIAQVLNFSNQNQLHENMYKLQEQINQHQTNIKLQIANIVCGQQKYNFLADFKNILKKFYQTELQQVDFANNHKNVRNKINSWVETETTIKKFIKPGILNNFTRLLLVNAIYFNGQWITPFKKTTQTPFWLSAKHSVEVSMMKQKSYFSYTSNNMVQILELPYAGEISMLVILPKQSLVKIENSLSKYLGKWLSRLRSQQVEIYLPKFKINTNLELSKTLVTMGM
ncbi:MAG TPA: serpin family protein, partial [Thioploca sp.]|nr:serpin family protein [Thioploca sp.]